MTTTSLPAEVLHRFWVKVDKLGPAPDGRPDLGLCWIWTAAKSKGYGRFMLPGRRLVQAHRLSYSLERPIPDGLELDHLCRNRACVNPTHLEPVTTRTNLLRGEGASARNAIKRTCPNGHEYDAVHSAGRNDRICLACRQAAQRARYRRRREAGVPSSMLGGGPGNLKRRAREALGDGREDPVVR